MNKNKFSIIAVIAVAALLVVAIAGAVIIDKFVIGENNQEKPKFDETLPEGDDDKKVPVESDSDSSTDKNDFDDVSKPDDSDEDNKAPANSGEANVGGPEGSGDADKSDKDSNKDKNDKDTSDTKRPQQNSSATQKDPVTNGSSSSDKDEETSGKDEPDVPAPLTYEEYNAMSREDQQAYFESFDNMQDYFEWYNDALAKYESEQEKIEGDGPIDIGDIFNGGGN